MRTTKEELFEMLKDFPDNAEIILVVRGNSTTDYSEQTITVESKDFDRIIVIRDNL